MKTEAPAIVYYNSACPVCDAGIAHQKGQMQSCAVTWIDIHRNPEAAQALGADLEFVRERLHVKDAEGKLHVGAPALAALWAQTPRQRWLGQLAQWPVFRPVFDMAYRVFARGLYRWNRWRKHW